ncbi:beta-hydroxyacid dehydrogenase, 3-hydroxyisobutyrate dehydrogenase [Leptolyngbyaceae cyanobacterium JSC-12]|nr:beta-hydroxyacid dehydrogenase, 3-hydroxyisobutyrate dehydrogenase [Leptolyngbyaceae cyanobacterium JSC-12]
MKIGFIGTGLMGLPMAERILNAQFPLIAYNRTTAKLAPLQQAGAELAHSPEALIRSVDCIVLMVTNAEAVRAMVLSETSRTELVGKTVIQMGTIAPAESRALCEAIIAAGGDYLEAPVLGSIPEAKTGNLIVMVGSTPAQFEQWQPVLRCFGAEPLRVGEVGTAAAIKLALNQLIGSLTSAFATSLGFVQQQGADVDVFMQILRGSALYAPTFDKKLQRMLEHNYANPNFPTKHLLKDTELFLQEAKSSSLNLAIPEAVQGILEQAMHQGLADKDYCALFSVVISETMHRL